MNACEVKDNSDWILIKYPHPPKSPPPRPLPPTCHINTPITRPDEWKWTELWCDSPSVKSIPPPILLLPSYFPPTHPLPPHPLSLQLSHPPLLCWDWRIDMCLTKGNLHQTRGSLPICPPPPALSWVENEQHSLLSLLYSRSKESIIVTPATRTVPQRSSSLLGQKWKACVGTGTRLCQNNKRRLIKRSGGRFDMSSPYNGFRF